MLRPTKAERVQLRRSEDRRRPRDGDGDPRLHPTNSIWDILKSKKGILPAACGTILKILITLYMLREVHSTVSHHLPYRSTVRPCASHHCPSDLLNIPPLWEQMGDQVSVFLLSRTVRMHRIPPALWDPSTVSKPSV